MPSGKIHDSIAIFSIPVVFLLGYYFFSHNLINSFIFVLSCLFCQLMFGPDLDTRSNHYKRWGLFRWIWIPYIKIIPHRSKFSHGILTGTLFRLIYLFFAVAFLIIFINQLIYSNFGFKIIDYESIKLFKYINSAKIIYLFPIILGLITGTIIHTLTDKIFSFFKNII